MVWGYINKHGRTDEVARSFGLTLYEQSAFPLSLGNTLLDRCLRACVDDRAYLSAGICRVADLQTQHGVLQPHDKLVVNRAVDDHA
jgi:hypothetical protein